MKGAVLGSRYLVSAGNTDHTVDPLRSGSSVSRQVNDVLPHSFASIPRLAAYQSSSACLSFALMNIPPIPVTFSMRTSPMGWMIPRSLPPRCAAEDAVARLGMQNARPGGCRSGRECVGNNGSDRLHLEHLGDGGADAALDPLLDGHGADRAGAARPHQPELEDARVEPDELHVAAVLAQRGADHVERVLDLLEKTDHSRCAARGVEAPVRAEFSAPDTEGQDEPDAPPPVAGWSAHA